MFKKTEQNVQKNGTKRTGNRYVLFRFSNSRKYGISSKNGIKEKNDVSHKATLLFKRLYVLAVKPDTFTFNLNLVRYAKLGSLDLILSPTCKLYVVTFPLQCGILSKKGGFYMAADLITVSEAAKRSGLSRQSVYKKLDTTLSDFLIVIDGQKMLDIRALQVLDKKKLTDVDASKFVTNGDKLTKALQDTIEILKNQLEKKDIQLAAQDETIKSQSETIKNLSDALQSAQALHAGTIQQQLTLPEKSGIWSRLFGKKSK